MGSTLINVCGVSRSGTTMIDLMLGNAPDAFSCGEVFAWFRPWRKHQFEIRCSCGKSPCPHWELIKDFPENVFHKQVFEKMKVEYVIDSSKDICWVIDSNRWAVRNDINVLNLLAWKDPIYLAYSHWKKKHNPDFWRNQFIEYYSRIFEAQIPFISVSFNELIQNPAVTLQQMCKVVGMKYFPGKERFWEGHHHFLFGNGGVRRQVQNGMSEIRQTDGFSPEFLAQIESLSQQIRDDQDIQSIVAKLKSTSIGVHKGNAITGDSRQGTLPHIRRPLWYYQDWLRRLYKRHFPEPFDHDRYKRAVQNDPS